MMKSVRRWLMMMPTAQSPANLLMSLSDVLSVFDRTRTPMATIVKHDVPKYGSLI